MCDYASGQAFRDSHGHTDCNTSHPYSGRCSNSFLPVVYRIDGEFFICKQDSSRVHWVWDSQPASNFDKCVQIKKIFYQQTEQ